MSDVNSFQYKLFSVCHHKLKHETLWAMQEVLFQQRRWLLGWEQRQREKEREKFFFFFAIATSGYSKRKIKEGERWQKGGSTHKGACLYGQRRVSWAVRDWQIRLWVGCERLVHGTVGQQGIGRCSGG